MIQSNLITFYLSTFNTINYLKLALQYVNYKQNIINKIEEK